MSLIKPARARLLSASLHMRAALVVGALLAVGAIFSVLNVNLVRSAEAAITAPQIDVPVPASDPFAEIWQKAPLAEIPLSAQQIWQPGGGSVQAVQVRALQDGQRVGFLVSWVDDTQNIVVRDNPSDATAIQLPMDPAHLPYQCMGQADNPVNIWQWRAANEVIAKASEGAIPYNGTRNLLSHGQGKVDEVQGVQPVANSVWQDGHWYVIFTRDLAPEGKGNAPLLAGETTNAAFAVWDGAKGETRAMKAVSTWTPVTLGGGGVNIGMNWFLMGVTILVSLGILALGYRFLPR